MKTKYFQTSIAIVGLVISLSCTSFSQEERERPGRGPDPRPPRSESPGQSQTASLFQVLDRNRDGKLQQNEIDMAVVILRRMDQNKDGDVSLNEIKSLEFYNSAGIFNHAGPSSQKIRNGKLQISLAV